MTNKEKNEACRSCLQDAIRSIKQADGYWNIVTDGFGLITALGELKEKVKRQLAPVKRKGGAK